MTPPDVRTPVSAAAATGLGALALTPVVSSERWLGPVVAAIVVVLLTGLALRAAGSAIEARSGPDRPVSERVAALGTVLVPLAQLAALVCWLTVRFAPDDATWGVVPTPASIGALVAVLGDGGGEIRTQVAPAEPVPALMALITLFVGLVAVLVDLVAVAGRQAAVGGLALLGLFCVPVFTLTGEFGLLPLAGPAAGLAVLLWADQCRRVGAGRRADSRTTGAGTGTRVGLVALLVGVVGGGMLPTVAEGSLTGGDGEGSTGTALNPVASMVGQLTLPDPIDLLRVRHWGNEPGYLRAVTVDEYDAEEGWSLGRLEPRVPLNSALPVRGGPEVVRDVTVTVEVLEHDDRFLPVPVAPTSVNIAGGENGWRFDPDTGAVVGTDVTTGDRLYDVDASEPRPSVEELIAAPAMDPEGEFMQRYTALPPLDPRVTGQVAELVAGVEPGYPRVRAILDFLTDRANGFVYRLATRPGTSGDDLADFLTEREGYCEQYAGAMAVMVRQAGMPARVALGYTPGTPQDDGITRLITSDDAHAWVEVYFDGVGWVPFDPTPIDTDRRADLPWAPRVATEDLPETAPELPAPAPEAPVAEPVIPEDLGLDPGGADLGGGSSDDGRVLPRAGVVLLVLALAALPAGVRRLQGRRRMADGSATALWDELTATADDLRLFRDPAWTPREAAGAFAARTGDPADAEAVARLARAEERASYGPPGRGADVEGLGAALRTARRALLRSAGRRERLRAVLWPASLFAAARARAVAWTERARALPGPWRRGARV